ncbi:hypothetical protein MKW92_049623, partial [Papaver armeniacum]
MDSSLTTSNFVNIMVYTVCRVDKRASFNLLSCMYKLPYCNMTYTINVTGF